MKILYNILALVFYLLASFISLLQVIKGDPMLVSQRRAKYPILTSLLPFNHSVWFILIYCFFIRLASKN